VETNSGPNLGGLASLYERALLVRFSPDGPVRFREYQRRPAFARCSLSEKPLAFISQHDVTGFFATRQKYRLGETARVRLAAMSYGVRPVQRLYFEIPEGESADILRAGLTNPPEGPVKISVQGMVGRFPIEEWGMDEYSFTSPVKGCRAFAENGRNFVEIEIGLHRNADGEAADIDVPLLVLEQLIEGTEALSQDDMIEGRYWLQGTLIDGSTGASIP